MARIEPPTGLGCCRPLRGADRGGPPGHVRPEPGQLQAGRSGVPDPEPAHAGRGGAGAAGERGDFAGACKIARRPSVGHAPMEGRTLDRAPVPRAHVHPSCRVRPYRGPGRAGLLRAALPPGGLGDTWSHATCSSSRARTSRPQAPRRRARHTKTGTRELSIFALRRGAGRVLDAQVHTGHAPAKHPRRRRTGHGGVRDAQVISDVPPIPARRLADGVGRKAVLKQRKCILPRVALTNTPHQGSNDRCHTFTQRPVCTQHYPHARSATRRQAGNAGRTPEGRKKWWRGRDEGQVYSAGRPGAVAAGGSGG